MNCYDRWLALRAPPDKSPDLGNSEFLVLNASSGEQGTVRCGSGTARMVLWIPARMVAMDGGITATTRKLTSVVRMNYGDSDTHPAASATGDQQSLGPQPGARRQRRRVATAKSSCGGPPRRSPADIRRQVMDTAVNRLAQIIVGNVIHMYSLRLPLWRTFPASGPMGSRQLCSGVAVPSLQGAGTPCAECGQDVPCTQESLHVRAANGGAYRG